MNTKLITCLLILSAAMPACMLTLSTADGAEYDRDEFKYNGYKMWPDIDRDCQDLRQELLIQYSLYPVTFEDAEKCRVKSGKWFDPYSNTTHTDPSALDVDHIVPLKWAHEHGAHAWNRAEKIMFATDLENLILTRSNMNESKGSRGPKDWMPPNERYHQEYLYRWQRIINKYGLK